MGNKITFNRKPLSDDEINSRKNFDELVKQFKANSIQQAQQSPNFFKTKKFVASTVIAGMVVICTVLYSQFAGKNNQEANKTKPTTSNEKPLLASLTPNNKISLPYTQYKVNANKPSVITHPTGSKIKLPKNAFVDNKGAVISGDVEIKYREMHDAVDVALSGVPMTYDSAGITYNFQSAGMLDIKGYQDGKEVYIAPDKKINVDLMSNSADTKFNVYYYDSTAKNWIYKGKDKISKSTTGVQSAVVSTVKQEKEISALEKSKEDLVKAQDAQISKLGKQPAKPEKPAKADPMHYKFNFDLDTKDFPELASYKDVMWEVGNENKGFDKKMYDVVWHDARLSAGTIPGKNYKLTLMYFKQKYDMIVYPVFEGNNYEQALAKFDEKVKSYNQKLTERLAKEEQLKKDYAAKLASIEEKKKALATQKTQMEEAVQRFAKEEAKTIANQLICARTFDIAKFGIYNSDHINQSESQLVNTFLYLNNKPIEHFSFMLAETKTNSYYAYAGKSGANFTLSKQPECIVFTTINGSMAVATQDEYRRASEQKQGNNLHLNLILIPDSITTPEELKKYLKLV